MTAHPIDTEALRARAEHVYRHGGPANAVESLAANIPAILDRLAATEHRATRAGAERDEWRQAALDERGAALDLLEQIKVRDKRIQAVRDVLELHGPAHDEHGQDEADCGPMIITDIRRALDGDA